MKKSILSLLAAVAGILLPSFAYAHVVAGETSGFLHGVMHPVSGLDHVCAMVAVGLWAAQMGGRSLRAVPLIFVCVMALGGVLGMAGIAMPFAETGIVLSVLVLGILVAASVRLPLWLGGSMVGLFALCHGHAHGMEMPGSVSGLEYALGFALATISLHGAGIMFGLGMHKLAYRRMVQLSGAAIALFGVFLAIG